MSRIYASFQVGNFLVKNYDISKTESGFMSLYCFVVKGDQQVSIEKKIDDTAVTE